MRSVEFHYLGFVRDLHAVRHAPSEGLEAIATTISIPEKLVKRCRIAKNGSMKLRQSQKTWISKAFLYPFAEMLNQETAYCGNLKESRYAKNMYKNAGSLHECCICSGGKTEQMQPMPDGGISSPMRFPCGSSRYSR